MKIQCSIPAWRLQKWVMNTNGDVSSFDPHTLSNYLGPFYYDGSTGRFYWEFEDDQLVLLQMILGNQLMSRFIKKFTFVSEDETFVSIGEDDCVAWPKI